jgi:UDP-glucose 4-epimerase
MYILVTGGAGYIGSHTTLLLLQRGFNVIVFDNLSNSSYESIRRIEKLTNKEMIFIEGDVSNREDLEKVFTSYAIETVIHFAGLKSVNESIEKPLYYYHNNSMGTIILCEVMEQYNCKSLIFSSSATVYGNPSSLPIEETFPLHPTNPYGKSKLMVEEILKDLVTSDNTWRIAVLRYFNPVGAHISGEIGEDPHGTPNNLMPFIAQTAMGKQKKLYIFGNDYPTPDGTGVRDYIHVMDLAEGHLAALDKIESLNGLSIVNIGTGRGYSVFELLETFEKVSKKSIPYEVVARRSGDIAACYTDVSYAKKVLHWEAKRTLKEMCEDTWRWQQKNPYGYKKPRGKEL